jgi:cytochrome b561
VSAEPIAYPPLLRRIHWITAALFLVAMAIGFWAGLQPPGTSPRREVLEIHKSLGMTLLVLSALRLIVRLSVRVPDEPQAGHGLTRLAAIANHWLLYLLLFAMPATGYAFSSAGNYSLKYFWTFSWPRLFAGDKAIAHAGELAHGALSYLVYGAVAIHIAATLWHAVLLRDGTLRRMWPAADKAAGPR